jgi:hypothetical protein
MRERKRKEDRRKEGRKERRKEEGRERRKEGKNERRKIKVFCSNKFRKCCMSQSPLGSKICHIKGSKMTCSKIGFVSPHLPSISSLSTQGADDGLQVLWKRCLQPKKALCSAVSSLYQADEAYPVAFSN